MQRLRRALYILAASIVATTLVLAVRAIVASGVFTSGEHQFRGVCRSVAGGAGDMKLDRRDGLLFASSSHQGPAEEIDGLYVARLDRLDRGFTRLPGTPANFHPRGLSLYRTDDGALELMAVNRPRGAEPAIESFDVHNVAGRTSLSQRASVTGGLLRDPIDVAAVAPDQFYVTNASTSVTRLGHLLESSGLVPRGNVVFFDGNVFRAVAEGFNAPSGIELSSDMGRAYVATTRGRTLYAFDRSPFSGSLKEVGSLSVGAALDSISRDESGNLWVASHPDLFGNTSRRRPSQLFKILLSGGMPASAELVYSDSGAALSGASVGVPYNANLVVGSPYEPKFLLCRFATR